MAALVALALPEPAEAATTAASATAAAAPAAAATAAAAAAAVADEPPLVLHNRPSVPLVAPLPLLSRSVLSPSFLDSSRGASPWRPRRDVSTATVLQYPMYVMRVSNFVTRYKSGIRLLEPHQKLKAEGAVVKWDGAQRVIFVSHEWVGFQHPDPEGEQTHALCKLLNRM